MASRNRGEQSGRQALWWFEVSGQITPREQGGRNHFPVRQARLRNQCPKEPPLTTPRGAIQSLSFTGRYVGVTPLRIWNRGMRIVQFNFEFPIYILLFSIRNPKSEIRNKPYSSNLYPTIQSSFPLWQKRPWGKPSGPPIRHQREIYLSVLGRGETGRVF